MSEEQAKPTTPEMVVFMQQEARKSRTIAALMKETKQPWEQHAEMCDAIAERLEGMVKP